MRGEFQQPYPIRVGFKIVMTLKRLMLKQLSGWNVQRYLYVNGFHKREN